jgi:pteridine reductase
MELPGKVALVTGSAHRLGKHIALALAREGCHLVIHYHHAEEEAGKTLSEIEALHVQAIAVQADLRQVDSIGGLFQEVDRIYGGLDILVNSAAGLQRIDLLKVSEQDWEQTINLNLKAAFFCLQEAARRMKSQGSGAIVNISDIIGRRPWPNFPVHSISKAGIEMLTKVAALALAPEIRVNAVVPGMVLRPDGMDNQRWQQMAAQSPLQKAGDPKDITNAIVFLLRNDYITGETFVVDGGMQWT